MKLSKPILRFLYVLSACVVLLGAGLGLYIYHLRAALQAELTTYLDEVAQRGVKILNTQIDGDMKSLQSAAAAIAVHPHDIEKHTWTDLLQEETKQNEFKRTAFIEPNGVAHLSDGFLLDLSHRDYFQQSLAGQTAVSDPLTDAVDQGRAIILSVPVITPQGKTLGVLMAAHPTELYGGLIASDSFGGQGYSLVMKSNGEKVAFSSSARTSPAQKNVFTTPGNEQFNRNKKLHEDLQAGRSGWVRFFHPEEGWLYVSYQPVGINDWYLLSVVPEKVAAQKTHDLLALSLILCLTGLLVLVSLLAFIYAQQKRTREALYQAAYNDPVTRRPNWAKIRLEIPKVLEQTPQALYALVVFDIKHFQLLHDQVGRQRADQLLRRIADLLAEELHENERACRFHDAFFVMLLNYETPEQLKNRLELLNEKIVNARPADLQAFQLILSFGIYSVQENISPEDMLLRATLAHNTLQGSYRDIVAFYEPAMRQRLTKEQDMENEMENALRQQDFGLRLSPLCRADGSVWGAQSHCVWLLHGETPLEEELFLSVFARNGFITQLDFYLAEQACRVLQQAPGEWPLLLNISALSLQDLRFVALLKKQMQQYRVPAQRLLLQINAARPDTTDMRLLYQNGQRAQQEGFRLALNLLGQNSISLPMMQKLPIFLARLENPWPSDGNFKDQTPKIVQGVLELGQKLDVRILFGAVQNAAQWQALQTLGAQFYDGPWAGKAQKPEDFLAQFFPKKQR